MLSSLPMAIVGVARPDWEHTTIFTVLLFMRLLRLSKLFRVDFLHDLESKSPVGRHCMSSSFPIGGGSFSPALSLVGRGLGVCGAFSTWWGRRYDEVNVK